MYVPKAFEVTDRATLYAFIDDHSFAILTTMIDGAPFATRLPLILEREAGVNGTLIGHVARANPHWRSFNGAVKALAMFDGPHAYISPNWYASAPAVPTWNYASVHAYGAPHLIEDARRVEAIVDRLVAIHEAEMPEPWSAQVLPPEFKANLLKGIVGFEMAIDRIEGKFKFGQNRPLEDQLATLDLLETSPHHDAQRLARLARRHLRLAAR
jgi:transcriptional regulator